MPTPSPTYVELQVTSNFSFLRGAAHPEELAAQAAAQKAEIAGELTEEQAHDIVFDVRAYVPVLYPSIDLVERALSISLTLDHPVYDCLYLACAETIDSILITADDRLRRVVQQTNLNDRVRHLSEAVTLIDQAGS